MGRLADFQIYLAQNDRRESTIKRHLWNTRLIFREVKPFTKEKIDDFFLLLKERGRRSSYLNSLVCSIRVYGQFKDISELASYRFFKEEPTIKATMSDQEIEALLSLPRPHRRGQNKRLWHRWTVFFSIMAYTGMRPGEVASLDIDDIDWGLNVLVIRKTKTDYPRLVPIPPNIKDLLKDYLKNTNPILFPGVDNVDWHYNFHRRLKILGIKRKNLTPYSLRHSMITRLLEEDVNLFKVQKLVGHKDIKTTAVYTHLTIKDIQMAIRKHPLIRRSTNPKEILNSLADIIKSFKLENDKRIGYNLKMDNKSLDLKVKIKKEGR